MTLQTLARDLKPAVLKAGQLILDIRAKGFNVEEKNDTSPVTEADRAAEDILVTALKALVPDAVIVAEEMASAGIMPETLGDEFYLIDPLDGTKEFIRGGLDFTVNIGLIKDGRPIMGIVYAPAQGRLFTGISGQGAYEENIVEGTTKEIKVRSADLSAIDAVASKSHRDEATNVFLEKFSIRDLKSAGSSLKFCLVAAGEADIYPRFGPTMEWDTAAGQAVLEAANGKTVHPDGSPYSYAKAAFKNGPFIAIGDRKLLGSI